jgi:hypothetical protein
MSAISGFSRISGTDRWQTVTRNFLLERKMARKPMIYKSGREPAYKRRCDGFDPDITTSRSKPPASTTAAPVTI